MTRLAPMITAELLKLRRRRGLVLFCLATTVGLTLIANGVMWAYHQSDAVKYPPTSGEVAFINMVNLFGILATLVPVIVGATAGAQDVESGVFRSLVATGRSRLSLALVRIPGALLLVLPMLLLAFAIEVGIAAIPLQGVAALHWGDVPVVLGWLVVTAVLNVALGIGIASLTGARGTAIGVIVIWQVAAGRLLERISAFGNLRGLISTVALDRFLPGASDTVQLTRVDSITVTTLEAVLVVAAWIAVATALGVWRTMTIDA